MIPINGLNIVRDIYFQIKRILRNIYNSHCSLYFIFFIIDVISDYLIIDILQTVPFFPSLVAVTTI